MLRVRPIHFTSRTEQWEQLLGALGLVKTVDDAGWLEFDAGSGRLALRKADHGSAEDGTTVFGVEAGELEEFARRTNEDGTSAGVVETPRGTAVRVVAHDGFIFLAEQAQRAADGTWSSGEGADPALAIAATWLTPDVDGAARELRNIGARPRSGTDTTADFTAKNGGILRVAHGASPESGDLSFEYDGALETLLQRLTAVHIEARVDDDVLHVANPDAATGAAPASIGITRAPNAEG